MLIPQLCSKSKNLTTLLIQRATPHSFAVSPVIVLLLFIKDYLDLILRVGSNSMAFPSWINIVLGTSL